MLEKIKHFVNDYATAAAVLHTAARPEKGKPLAARTRLVVGPNFTACVQFLYVGWRSIPSEPTDHGAWHPGRSERYEEWRTIVTYYPDGAILLNSTGSSSDSTLWDRIDNFSPVMTYKQGYFDYIRYFRWRGRDYVFGDAGVFLPADHRRRPRYAPCVPARSYKSKDFPIGKPCILRDVWNKRETDKDEARHLLNRLGYLITRHGMGAAFDWQMKRRLAAYQHELTKQDEDRQKKQRAKLEAGQGRQLRSIDLETPCGAATIPDE